MNSSNRCVICMGPLPEYKGRGRIPEIHSVCGDVKSAVTRLEVALRALSTEYTQQQLQAMRKWLTGELWRMVNTSFNPTAIRRPARTPQEELERMIKRMSRTRAGRLALLAYGLACALSEGSSDISRKEREV